MIKWIRNAYNGIPQPRWLVVLVCGAGGAFIGYGYGRVITHAIPTIASWLSH